jgi:DNA-binding transcriptional MerR regulator
MDSHLSPAETAKRFGISIKALRLYEQHGLLKPLRTANGSTGAAWRVYGSDQIARLHQVLALKRLGLPRRRRWVLQGAFVQQPSI